MDRCRLRIKHKQIMKGAANTILIKSCCMGKILQLHMEHYYVVLFVEEPGPLWLVGIVAFSLSSLRQTLFALHMWHAWKTQHSVWSEHWGTISKTYNSTIACSLAHRGVICCGWRLGAAWNATVLKPTTQLLVFISLFFCIKPDEIILI